MLNIPFTDEHRHRRRGSCCASLLCLLLCDMSIHAASLNITSYCIENGAGTCPSSPVGMLDRMAMHTDPHAGKLRSWQVRTLTEFVLVFAVVAEPRGRRRREEGGGGVDETSDPFLGDEATFQKLEEKQKQEAQRQKHLTRRDGSQMTLSQSKRHSEVQKDINAWEENRLFTSGVVRAREVRARSGTQGCASDRIVWWECRTFFHTCHRFRAPHALMKHAVLLRPGDETSEKSVHGTSARALPSPIERLSFTREHSFTHCRQLWTPSRC